MARQQTMRSDNSASGRANGAALSALCEGAPPISLPPILSIPLLNSRLRSWRPSSPRDHEAPSDATDAFAALNALPAAPLRSLSFAGEGPGACGAEVAKGAWQISGSRSWTLQLPVDALEPVAVDKSVERPEASSAQDQVAREVKPW